MTIRIDFATETGHLLDEFNTLKYILLGDLRDLLDERPDELNRKWLLVVLDALLDTLPQEFELQQEGGYLSEVLEQCPNWTPLVEQLEREQHELFRNLGRLRQRLDLRQSFTDVADELRRDFFEWMNLLIAHRRHEHRLVQEAFNLEVGVGD